MRTSRLRFFLLMIGILAPVKSGLRSRPPIRVARARDLRPEQALSLTLDEALKMVCAKWDYCGTGLQRERRDFHRARSVLYPNLSGGFRENAQQIDLQSFGFISNFLPARGSIFHRSWAHSTISICERICRNAWPMNAIRPISPPREAQHAAELSAADPREIVVYVVTAAYLQVLAESVSRRLGQSAVDSAQTIFQQARSI